MRLGAGYDLTVGDLKSVQVASGHATIIDRDDFPSNLWLRPAAVA
ncbi:hypothetical protein [Methylobacterium sp. Leaf113]|nr:hypothetical protein [Methylobacterium sp. Leaf113]